MKFIGRRVTSVFFIFILIFNNYVHCSHSSSAINNKNNTNHKSYYHSNNEESNDKDNNDNNKKTSNTINTSNSLKLELMLKLFYLITKIVLNLNLKTPWYNEVVKNKGLFYNTKQLKRVFPMSCYNTLSKIFYNTGELKEEDISIPSSIDIDYKDNENNIKQIWEYYDNKISNVKFSMKTCSDIKEKIKDYYNNNNIGDNESNNKDKQKQTSDEKDINSRIINKDSKDTEDNKDGDNSDIVKNAFIEVIKKYNMNNSKADSVNKGFNYKLLKEVFCNEDTNISNDSNDRINSKKTNLHYRSLCYQANWFDNHLTRITKSDKKPIKKVDVMNLSKKLKYIDSFNSRKLRKINNKRLLRDEDKDKEISKSNNNKDTTVTLFNEEVEVLKSFKDKTLFNDLQSKLLIARPNTVINNKCKKRSGGSISSNKEMSVKTNRKFIISDDGPKESTDIKPNSSNTITVDVLLNKLQSFSSFDTKKKVSDDNKNEKKTDNINKVDSVTNTNTDLKSLFSKINSNSEGISKTKIQSINNNSNTNIKSDDEKNKNIEKKKDIRNNQNNNNSSNKDKNKNKNSESNKNNIKEDHKNLNKNDKYKKDIKNIDTNSNTNNNSSDDIEEEGKTINRLELEYSSYIPKIYSCNNSISQIIKAQILKYTSPSSNSNSKKDKDNNKSIKLKTKETNTSTNNTKNTNNNANTSTTTYNDLSVLKIINLSNSIKLESIAHSYVDNNCSAIIRIKDFQKGRIKQTRSIIHTIIEIIKKLGLIDEKEMNNKRNDKNKQQPSNSKEKSTNAENDKEDKEKNGDNKKEDKYSFTIPELFLDCYYPIIYNSKNSKYNDNNKLLKQITLSGVVKEKEVKILNVINKIKNNQYGLNDTNNDSSNSNKSSDIKKNNNNNNSNSISNSVGRSSVDLFIKDLEDIGFTRIEIDRYLETIVYSLLIGRVFNKKDIRIDNNESNSKDEVLGKNIYDKIIDEVKKEISNINVIAKNKTKSNNDNESDNEKDSRHNKKDIDIKTQEKKNVEVHNKSSKSNDVKKSINNSNSKSNSNEIDSKDENKDEKQDKKAKKEKKVINNNDIIGTTEKINSKIKTNIDNINTNDNKSKDGEKKRKISKTKEIIKSNISEIKAKQDSIDKISNNLNNTNTDNTIKIINENNNTNNKTDNNGIKDNKQSNKQTAKPKTKDKKQINIEKKNKSIKETKDTTDTTNTFTNDNVNDNNKILESAENKRKKQVEVLPKIIINDSLLDKIRKKRKTKKFKINDNIDIDDDEEIITTQIDSNNKDKHISDDSIINLLKLIYKHNANDNGNSNNNDNVQKLSKESKQTEYKKLYDNSNNTYNTKLLKQHISKEMKEVEDKLKPVKMDNKDDIDTVDIVEAIFSSLWFIQETIVNTNNSNYTNNIDDNAKDSNDSCQLKSNISFYLSISSNIKDSSSSWNNYSMIRKLIDFRINSSFESASYSENKKTMFLMLLRKLYNNDNGNIKAQSKNHNNKTNEDNKKTNKDQNKTFINKQELDFTKELIERYRNNNDNSTIKNKKEIDKESKDPKPNTKMLSLNNLLSLIKKTTKADNNDTTNNSNTRNKAETKAKRRDESNKNDNDSSKDSKDNNTKELEQVFIHDIARLLIVYVKVKLSKTKADYIIDRLITNDSELTRITSISIKKLSEKDVFSIINLLGSGRLKAFLESPEITERIITYVYNSYIIKDLSRLSLLGKALGLIFDNYIYNEKSKSKIKANTTNATNKSKE